MRRLAALVVVLCACAGPAADQPAPPRADVVSGTARVVDGDTLVIGRERIRIKRINAPEMNTEAGRRAKAVMQALVGDGVVTCTGAVRDAYARRLADCAVGGRDLGAAMIAEGAARRR